MAGLYLALHIEHLGELVLLLPQQFQQCLYQDLATVVFLPLQVLTMVFHHLNLLLRQHHQTSNCTGDNLTLPPSLQFYFPLLFTLADVSLAAGKLFSLLAGFCPSQNGLHGTKLLNIVLLHTNITLSYLLFGLNIDTWEM